ncbi:MAG: hypothetical protein HN368_23250 [Spirochaetales bacterium]|jgi:hypothetical protein|nr:hypothetical protein [Spirochaetales bacterium]
MSDGMTIATLILTAITAAGAAAAAIASYVLIHKSNVIRKQEINDRRPTFMIDLSEVQIKEEMGYFFLNMPIKNHGRRPAVNCVS